jgi:hypothetical protein
VAATERADPSHHRDAETLHRLHRSPPCGRARRTRREPFATRVPAERAPRVPEAAGSGPGGRTPGRG